MKQIVYVVINTHDVGEVTVWEDKNEAIEHAKKVLLSEARFPQQYSEEDWSCEPWEDEDIFVLETELKFAQP